MSILFTNNAATTLASSITDTATSLTVASGKGALFPTITGADYFYATLANSSGGVEIVKVTARSTDTFTIVRGQDGTSAAAWNTGDKVELRATAADLTAMAQKANNLSDLASASTARTNLGLGSDSTGSNLSSLTNAGTARTNLGLAAIAASGSASDLSSGTTPTARLGSGTASSSTYLRGDQTWAAVTSLPGILGQVFTSSGTFTIPAGVTALKVTVIGGGGGSGGYASGSQNTCSGGGGAGGTGISFLTGLTPGNTIAVTVGAAGTAAASGNNTGGTGGSSSIASGTQTITTITCTGGSGGSGTGGSTSNGGGSGGTSTGASINKTGGAGAPGVYFGSACCAGRGGYGYGGSALFPNNHQGTYYGGNASGTPQGYGNGAGSSRAGAPTGGIAGVAGVVIFEW